MDHRYIDEHSVAQRYLAHSLSLPERAEFEAHLVDCQECTDRLLLAEMFRNRNGTSKRKPAEVVVKETVKYIREPEPLRVAIARMLTPWQMLLIATIAAALLVLVPSLLLLWFTGR